MIESLLKFFIKLLQIVVPFLQNNRLLLIFISLFKSKEIINISKDFNVMKKVTLIRVSTSDEGTLGKLTCDNFECVTLELPCHNNIRGKSCAPAGTYLFKWRTDSPKHGACYEEWDDPNTPQREDIPDRDNIQIHSANLAGDEDKGFIKQLDGCIALGKAVALFKAGSKPAGNKDQHGITESKTITSSFNTLMNKETFELNITWATGVNPEKV